MKWKIKPTPEYTEWFSSHSEKHKSQIAERLRKIEESGHFGVHKRVDGEEDIWELKWVCGWRVYYIYIDKLNLLLLMGGNKNGQKTDIKQAKKISRSYQKLGS